MSSPIRLHKGDISAEDAARYTGDIAIDTETLGLVPRRDRLCVVQLSPATAPPMSSRLRRTDQRPRLEAMLSDPAGARSSISAASTLPCSSTLSGW